MTEIVLLLLLSHYILAVFIICWLLSLLDHQVLHRTSSSLMKLVITTYWY